MSNAKTLHLQFADGEIEVGTLIDALYEQERTIAILRQHKNDYMEAAEGTRKALEAENARLERLVSHWQGLAVTNRKVADDALAQLAAIQGGMGDADKHKAQPEVAENTGSHAMATNQLQRQEQAVGRDVEGAATPCEASLVNDIFAWATFDGEGSYVLRLFEENESYRDDFRRNNPRHHPDWVFPLYRNSITAAMAAEVERLKRENANIRVKWTEYERELEAERDALAAELAIARRVIGRIGQLCTTPHESKERFIRRVQSVIEWQTAAQQDQPK